VHRVTVHRRAIKRRLVAVGHDVFAKNPPKRTAQWYVFTLQHADITEHPGQRLFIRRQRLRGRGSLHPDMIAADGRPISPTCFAQPAEPPYTLDMLKAIVFDFDGVVVDSEPVHYQAFMEIGRGLGVSFDYQHYLRHYIGFDDRDAIRTMLTQAGLPATDEHIAELRNQKQQVFEKLLNRGAAAIPGAVELIDEAHAHIPIAVGSGATTLDIELMLASLGRRDRFEVIVSADHVRRSKPDPETYRMAVEQLAALHPDLGLAPKDCLAIEDTAAGIESARGAGLMTLGITTTGLASSLSRAHRVEPGLEGVSLTTLRQWFDGEV
jgi:HAD superfamily hydrolase (TIGR01509 family)